MIKKTIGRLPYEVRPEDIAVGKQFRVKSLEWFNENCTPSADGSGRSVLAKNYQFDFSEGMTDYCDKVYTVTSVSDEIYGWYNMHKNPLSFHLDIECGSMYTFTPEMVDFV